MSPRMCNIAPACPPALQLRAKHFGARRARSRFTYLCSGRMGRPMLSAGTRGPCGPRTMVMALFLLLVASDKATAGIIPNPGLLCSRSPESKALRHRKCNIDNSRNYCWAMTHDCGDVFKNMSLSAVANMTMLTDAMQQVVRLSNIVESFKAEITTVKAEITTLKEQVSAFTNSSAVPTSWPYDEVTCRAKSYTDFPRIATGSDYAVWMNVGIDTTCDSSHDGKTCAHICAQNGLKCDPCAISKLSCQNAIHFAAQQTTLSPIKIQQYFGEATPAPSSWGLLGWEPGCTATDCQGPWNQTTCETATEPNKVNVQGTLLSTRYTDRYPGLTMQEWILTSAGGRECLSAVAVWKRVYNFYDPTIPNTYIDPATACNQPVAVIKGSSLHNGAMCYCRK